MAIQQSSNSNPNIQYRTPDGQTTTGPLNEAPPQIQLLYQNLPQAQAQTSTAQSGAISAGQQAQQQVVQTLQKKAQLGLKDDLSNKMTLPNAISKYTALGISADDIFKQYLSESPWGLPNQSPTQLQNLGISPDSLGQIGQNGSFADRWNTKQAILGTRDLKNKFNQVNVLSKLGINGIGLQTPSGGGYQAQRNIIGAHISSLIPGASGAQATGQELAGGLPNVGDFAQLEPGAANDKFNGVEAGLMNVKGYKYSDLGLTAPGQEKSNSGKDLLNNLLNVALPAGGAIAGGIAGGVAGAAIPGADLTGVPEGVGAVGGAGVGGAGGQGLADILEGKKPGRDLLTTGVLSAAGEGVGGLIGALGGKLGGVIGKYGEGLISKNLNLTPKMASDAASDMGVKSIPDFLSKEGLKGANYEKISSAVEPIQQQFDSVAKNPDIKINPQNVIDGFDKQIRTLQDSILPADHAKATVLQTIADNFATKFKDAPTIGADAMTALRQTVDKGVKDFGSDPLVASTGNLTRGILQKSIQEADPSKSLDALGTKLHQYYTLLGKSEPRQFASSVKPLLGMKDAVAGFLGNVFGGPVGAGAGIGIEKLLGTQAGTNVVSKGATGLGNILKSGVLKGGIRATGAATGGGIGGLLGIQ